MSLSKAAFSIRPGTTRAPVKEQVARDQQQQRPGRVADQPPVVKRGADFAAAAPPVVCSCQDLLQAGLQQAGEPGAGVGGQRAARAKLDHAPAFEDQDIVGALHRPQAVGDDDAGAAAPSGAAAG